MAVLKHDLSSVNSFSPSHTPSL